MCINCYIRFILYFSFLYICSDKFYVIDILNNEKNINFFKICYIRNDIINK